MPAGTGGWLTSGTPAADIGAVDGFRGGPGAARAPLPCGTAWPFGNPAPGGPWRRA